MVPRGEWQKREAQPQTPRLMGAETGRGRMAVNWATKMAQVVCYRCGKKGHFQSKYGKEQRIRILELEKEVEELKGKGGQ